MIVTEEEAKTKRCQEGFAAATGISADGVPVMQPASAGPVYPISAMGYYAVSHGGAPMNCIGSACMAWEWGATPIIYDWERADGDDPGAPWYPVRIADGNKRAYWARQGERVGYCGKAARR